MSSASVARRRARQRQLGLLLGGVSLGLLVFYLVAFAGIDKHLIGRSDFTSTYVGALLLSHGQGTQLYNETLQTALHSALIYPDKEQNLPFVNPPTAALLTLPFTLLSLDTAYHVWSLMQLGLMTAGLALAAWVAPFGRRLTAVAVMTVLTAIALPGTLSLLLLGQWDGVSVLGLGIIYWGERRGHPLLGWALGVTALVVAKPHLVIGLAAFVILRRAWRPFFGAAIGLVIVLVSSLLIGGFGVIGGFFHESLSGATRWALYSMLGSTGLVSSWFGNSSTTVLAVGLVFSLIAVVACAVLGEQVRRRPDLFEYGMAGAIALSLFASPHLLGQDLVLLGAALVMAMALASTRDKGGWPGTEARRILALWLLVMITGLIDVPRPVPLPVGRLVSWALILCGVSAVVALRRCRPRTTAAAAEPAVSPHQSGL